MKKLIRLGAVLFVLAAIGPSCEMQDDCKTCKLVVYENGSKISETTGTSYCGDDLADKENANPVVVGNRTSVYECE